TRAKGRRALSSTDPGRTRAHYLQGSRMASKLPSSPVWLITGCSAGFGRALAERVLAHRHRCVVTAPTVSTVEAIAAPYPDTAVAVALDVTLPTSRERALRAADDRF